MVIELAPSGGGGKAVYELTFGNASGEAKKPPPLEVSFEGLSEEAVQVGFSVEPKKLSVEARFTRDLAQGCEMACRPWALLRRRAPPKRRPFPSSWERARCRAHSSASLRPSA